LKAAGVRHAAIGVGSRTEEGEHEAGNSPGQPAESNAMVMNMPEVMGAQVQSKADAASGELTDKPTGDVIARQQQNFATFVRKIQAVAALQA
jgi:hypothetical protein